MFRCDTEDLDLEMQKITEEEVMQDISKALAALGPIRQFAIGSYRIDLYLSKPKIAMECDENGHRAYEQQAEMQRQTFIEEQLGCTFVRFDPYAPGFSVLETISRVVEKLVA